jgi:hypothetical protein
MHLERHGARGIFRNVTAHGTFIQADHLRDLAVADESRHPRRSLNSCPAFRLPYVCSSRAGKCCRERNAFVRPSLARRERDDSGHRLRDLVMKVAVVALRARRPRHRRHDFCFGTNDECRPQFPQSENDDHRGGEYDQRTYREGEGVLPKAKIP